MTTDKLRKYVIPNIPYVFVWWAFAQLGEAYRIAAGASFGMKLIGMAKTIGPAFETIAPGHGSDLLVGLCGAALFRLIIYHKVKNAKNFGGMWSTARPGGARKRTSSPLSIPNFKTTSY